MFAVQFGTYLEFSDLVVGQHQHLKIVDGSCRTEQQEDEASTSTYMMA